MVSEGKSLWEALGWLEAVILSYQYQTPLGFFSWKSEASHNNLLCLLRRLDSRKAKKEKKIKEQHPPPPQQINAGWLIFSFLWCLYAFTDVSRVEIKFWTLKPR